MKNLILISCFALLGACQNYSMADGQQAAGADAQAASCSAEMKECSGAQCEEKTMAACCAEAKAAGKDCASCPAKKN